MIQRKVFKLIPFLMLIAGSICQGANTQLIPLKHLYAPSGFDSNDNVEIFVAGYLPNLCYQSPKPNVEVNWDQKIIHVELTSEVREGGPCIEMLIPFLKPISLGPLFSGDYKVIVNSELPFELKGQIQIVDAETHAQDQFLYAKVEVLLKDSEDPNRIFLEGTFPNECFRWETVKQIWNGKDTLAILPIVKEVTPNCEPNPTPFSKMVRLPQEVKGDAILIHVRSMGGFSINQLVYKP